MARVIIEHTKTDVKTIEYAPCKVDGSLVDAKAPFKTIVLGSTVDDIDATKGLVGAPPFRFDMDRGEYDVLLRSSRPFKAYVDQGVVRVGGVLQ